MEGRKDDQNKLRMDLIPPDVIEAMAAVLTDGAKRYGDRNWEQGMAWSRPYAALLRHMLAWWQGEDTDPDSGRPHLWHALCCIAFLVAYEQRTIGVDDRPGRGAQQLVEEMLRWRQGGMQPSLADLVDWSEAPEWANHAVQQPNGTIIWINAKRHHDIGIQAGRGCWFLRPWVQNEVYKENITLAHDHSKLLPRPSTTDNDEEPEGWKLRPWEIHEDRDIPVTDQEDEAFEMMSVRRSE